MKSLDKVLNRCIFRNPLPHVFQMLTAVFLELRICEATYVEICGDGRCMFG